LFKIFNNLCKFFDYLLLEGNRGKFGKNFFIHLNHRKASSFSQRKVLEQLFSLLSFDDSFLSNLGINIVQIFQSDRRLNLGQSGFRGSDLDKLDDLFCSSNHVFSVVCQERLLNFTFIQDDLELQVLLGWSTCNVSCDRRSLPHRVTVSRLSTYRLAWLTNPIRRSLNTFINISGLENLKDFLSFALFNFNESRSKLLQHVLWQLSNVIESLTLSINSLFHYLPYWRERGNRTGANNAVLGEVMFTCGSLDLD